MKKHEHETLYVHCATCKKDNVKLTMTQEHGLAVICYTCNEPVLTVQNGTEFESILKDAFEHGCEHCNTEATQLPN